MEENEVLDVEVEASAEELDVFDTAFDDDDFSLGEESEQEESQEEQAAQEGDSDEHNRSADDTNAEQTEEPAEEQTEEPGGENEEGNQFLEIDYLGNKEQLTREQAKELAQKGRNYDHVVEERDKLRSEAGRHKAFLQKLADRAGVSIDEQIDLTEAMWLMDEEAEKGNSLTEAEALLRVQKNRREQPEEKEEPKAETQDSTNQMIDRFLAVYPDVKATDIPTEVWDSARQTGDLLGAYQAHEIKRLKAENEKVKQEARNERNSQRSTGPRKSSGSSKTLDDFDAGWGFDD